MNMINLRSCMMAGAVMALGFSITGAQAQFREDTGRTYRQQTGGVNEINKASNLVGMTVQNHRNQQLGEIEDVVIDVQSGRVSYVVLALEGANGNVEKRLAVPITAFLPSPTGQALVLHVDRQRLDRVQGIGETNWPDPRNPRLGALLLPPERDMEFGRQYQRQYQQQELPSVGERGARMRPGDAYFDERAFADTERDRFDREMDGRGAWLGNERYQRDRFGRADRVDRFEGRAQFERDTDFEGAYGERRYREERFAADDEPRTFGGEIVAVDPESRTVTVRGDTGTMHFEFAERPVIVLKNMRSPGIANLKVGYDVNVMYETDRYGNHIAKRVIRTTAPEVR